MTTPEGLDWEKESRVLNASGCRLLLSDCGNRHVGVVFGKLRYAVHLNYCALSVV